MSNCTFHFCPQSYPCVNCHSGLLTQTACQITKSTFVGIDQGSRLGILSAWVEHVTIRDCLFRDNQCSAIELEFKDERDRNVTRMVLLVQVLNATNTFINNSAVGSYSPNVKTAPLFLKPVGISGDVIVTAPAQSFDLAFQVLDASNNTVVWDSSQLWNDVSRLVFSIVQSSTCAVNLVSLSSSPIQEDGSVTFYNMQVYGHAGSNCTLLVSSNPEFNYEIQVRTNVSLFCVSIVFFIFRISIKFKSFWSSVDWE